MCHHWFCRGTRGTHQGVECQGSGEARGHEAGEDDAVGELGSGRGCGAEGWRPEEDEEVHGSFEDCGGEAEGEDLRICEDLGEAVGGFGVFWR